METELEQFRVVFMPDGRPAPAVLTVDELILLLRLDGKHPERTIKYYRDEGLLVGIPLGRKTRYPIDEVMRFLAEKTAKSRSNGLLGHNS
jgi:hypothetical protein